MQPLNNALGYNCPGVEMEPTLLLRYQKPVVAINDMPSGTSTFTRVEQESGDTDCATAPAGPTYGTGTFTAMQAEAPDRDHMASGGDFVFPH